MSADTIPDHRRNTDPHFEEDARERHEYLVQRFLELFGIAYLHQRMDDMGYPRVAPSGVTLLTKEEMAEMYADREMRLEEMAEIDDLTRARTKKKLVNDWTNDRIEERAKKGELFAGIRLDLDGLKYINDTEPAKHIAGDKLLVELSNIVFRNFRNLKEGSRGWEKGRLYRLYNGGDEFFMILSLQDPSNLFLVPEAIGKEYSKEAAIKAGITVVPKATLSMGAAILSPGIGLEEFLHNLDDLAYKAKAKRAKLVYIDQGEIKEIDLS
jgi:diguanylate cyclase (GGDEF)-like protein